MEYEIYKSMKKEKAIKKIIKILDETECYSVSSAGIKEIKKRIREAIEKLKELLTPPNNIRDN